MTERTGPQAPRLAATVILLRDGADGIEVLLLRRHAASGFFGDAYAFPGGRLDDSDQSEALWRAVAPEVIERCAALSPTPGQPLTREQSLGLFVAGCRELFEEAGVLLARALDGAPWDAPEPQVLDGLRRAVHAGELQFSEALARLGATLDPGRLGVWGHWITPSVEGKRYDTRFFMAAHPSRQTVRRDEIETTDELWLSPSAALARQQRGELSLPPPTLHVLDELGRLFGGGGVTRLPALLAARMAPAVMPRVGAPDGLPAVILPWDPTFEQAQGERLPGAIDYPPEWRAGPSRVVLQDGVWRLERP